MAARKVIPKGYRIKREGRVMSDDRMYSSLVNKWIEPTGFMIGKNVGTFIAVIMPRVRL